MTDPRHPIDDLVRQLSGNPTPSESDVRRASERLNAAIQASMPDRTRRLRKPAVAWAAVVSLVVGLFAVFGISQTTAAEAAMGEIAQVVEVEDPLTVDDTGFAYTVSETTALSSVPADGLGDVTYGRDWFVYLLPQTWETWIGDLGTVQIRTTAHDPIFFEARDQAVYFAAGIDQQDQIGETITTAISDPDRKDWPTDPTELDEAIRADMVSDRGLPETVEYLDVALDIVREPLTSPELRANTLRLIGGLRGLDVAPGAGGQSVFFVDYEEQGVEKRFEFAFDADGYFSLEQITALTADTTYGIPAATVVFRADYSPPALVDTLNSAALSD